MIAKKWPKRIDVTSDWDLQRCVLLGSLFRVKLFVKSLVQFLQMYFFVVSAVTELLMVMYSLLYYFWCIDAGVT